MKAVYSLKMTMTMKVIAMMMMMKLLCLTSAAFGPALTGNATQTFVSRSSSACPGLLDYGVFIAAAGDELWNNGEGCGKTYTIECAEFSENRPVVCPNENLEVPVMIVDHCSPPKDCSATFDLHPAAFSFIGEPHSQTIPILYREA